MEVVCDAWERNKNKMKKEEKKIIIVLMSEQCSLLLASTVHSSNFFFFFSIKLVRLLMTHFGQFSTNWLIKITKKLFL
jgi:hypothetical protein